MTDKTRDIIIRAAKTFAQAALGVAIPEIITMLNGGVTIDAIKCIGCAALAAGISAAWNWLLNRKKGEDQSDD